MKKEVARAILKDKQDELRQSEIVIDIHQNRMREIKEDIAELEATINKKDDWRDGLAKCGADPCFRMLLPTRREYYFRTSEQVGIANKKVQLMIEMLQFAHVKNEGWLPDWDFSKPKWGVSYSEKGILKVFGGEYCNDFIFGIAVKSEEIAKEMMDEFGERIDAVYNKQY